MEAFWCKTQGGNDFPSMQMYLPHLVMQILSCGLEELFKEGNDHDIWQHLLYKRN